MTEIALLRTRVRDGWPRRLLRWVATASDRLVGEGPVQRLLQRLVEPWLVAEGIHTESVFLERGDDGDHLLWYIEYEDAECLRERFNATDAPGAWLSQVAIEVILEDTGAFTDPERFDEFDRLVHATNPARPGRPG